MYRLFFLINHGRPVALTARSAINVTERYTGGMADGQGNGFQKLGYVSCMAKCPGGFKFSTLNLDGPTATESTGAADVSSCYAACKGAGCTGFEYSGAKCYLFSGGDEDVTNEKRANILGASVWTTCIEEVGRWEVARTGGSKGATKTDTFCGKSTDTLSIGTAPSQYCEKNFGAEGQVVVNQDGEDRTKAWFCSNQAATTIVGTPTFTPEDACSNEHGVADAGK